MLVMAAHISKTQFRGSTGDNCTSSVTENEPDECVPPAMRGTFGRVLQNLLLDESLNAYLCADHDLPVGLIIDQQIHRPILSCVSMTQSQAR